MSRSWVERYTEDVLPVIENEMVQGERFTSAEIAEELDDYDPQTVGKVLKYVVENESVGITAEGNNPKVWRAIDLQLEGALDVEEPTPGAERERAETKETSRRERIMEKARDYIERAGEVEYEELYSFLSERLDERDSHHGRMQYIARTIDDLKERYGVEGDTLTGYHIPG